MEYIQAKNYHAGRLNNIDLIVIHSMEVAEYPNVAKNVALSWHSAASPMASAHFCIDSNNIIQCVKLEDTAYHAPGVNSIGIGIEHAGYAAQTGAQWHDDYSTKMLELSAGLVAKLCIKYNIPVVFIDSVGLINKQRGITTHVAVTNAFHKSDHTDPGKNFPMDEYLDKVNAYIVIPDDSIIIG